MSNTRSDTYEGFSAEERAAMKEHAQEQKTAARRGSKADKAAPAEQDVLAEIAEIAEMQDADRAMAERVHAVVTAIATRLAPKPWYGMPACALDGRIVCFFQSAAKFKARYATLGFNDQARLDEGSMWATAFALTEVTPEVEEQIAALLQRAAGWACLQTGPQAPAPAGTAPGSSGRGAPPAAGIPRAFGSKGA
jgi:uncharacterized protein YdhG (YjbR/CyaY superfamily)